jgi:hypothetical protein
MHILNKLISPPSLPIINKNYKKGKIMNKIKFLLLSILILSGSVFASSSKKKCLKEALKRKAVCHKRVAQYYCPPLFKQLKLFGGYSVCKRISAKEERIERKRCHKIAKKKKGVVHPGSICPRHSSGYATSRWNTCIVCSR